MDEVFISGLVDDLAVCSALCPNVATVGERLTGVLAGDLAGDLVGAAAALSAVMWSVNLYVVGERLVEKPAGDLGSGISIGRLAVWRGDLGDPVGRSGTGLAGDLSGDI